MYESEKGRIMVTDSLTYVDDRVGAKDVIVGASFAGVPTVAVVLSRGVKAVIAHAAGVGKDEAGISGLPLAQRFGIPAAAVETMSARLSDGRSLYKGTISHANDAAARLGVRSGQSTEQAARLLLHAPICRAVDVSGFVNNKIQTLQKTASGGIYAVWSLSLIKDQRSKDVFCVASHSGKAMADYARTAAPKGIIANDAGMGMDNSGIDGLPVLNEMGIAVAAVAAMSARIGDALSTYNDGICSAVNRVAESKGVRLGMPAKEAARLLLG